MKTIITTLPIYDKLSKQCYERANSVKDDGLGVVPIISARHRLPSFQWLDGSDGAASVSKIETVDINGIATDITAKFTLPAMIPLNNDYFQYSGTTLNSLLNTGTYYLKITTNNAKIYYSEWFKVDCVFSDSNLPPTATYSTKYLIWTFYHSINGTAVDFGDILYHHGFTQVLYLESDALEPSFPTEEQGQTNGDGRFVRTFARQTKKYSARTKLLPAYMVDVFNRMKLHGSVTMIDLVGDSHTIYNLEVEHEWYDEEKNYALISLKFDYDETVLVSGCASNIA